ncbi:MAG: MazG nucleotide pyrophosphohydrolase domain-containing protein [Woeseiaceae bacterium]
MTPPRKKRQTALERAARIGTRAAAVGFDWPDSEGPKQKVIEELQELAEAERGMDKERVIEELGDLLFAVVNLARHLGADPEQALAGANAKFQRRFRLMDEAIRADGLTLGELAVEALEDYWQSVK